MGFDVSWNEMFAPLRMRMEIDRHNSAMQEAQARRTKEVVDFQNKQNNDMLEFLWKAGTDNAVPPEVFAHFKDALAGPYAKMMTPQQQMALDMTITRGLYSKQDRLADEYFRIKGKRPADVQLQGSFQDDLAQQMSLISNKVQQAEYDWGLKVHKAGSSDENVIGTQPKMVPVTSFQGKEGEMHQIYGYRDMATGQIKGFDTQDSASLGLLASANKEGWSTSMATLHDFVPMKGQIGGKIVTTGEKQYNMMSGVSLTTGEFKTVKIPLGKKDSSSGLGSGGKSRLNLSPRAENVLDELNLYSAGLTDRGDMKTTAGTWTGFLDRIHEHDLSASDFSADGLPNRASKIGQDLVQMQAEGIRRHKTLFVPRFRTIDQFWPFDSYEAQDSTWSGIPCDGAMPLLVDGKRQDFWYTKDIPGVEGQHHWFDMYGRKIIGFDSVAPGTPVKTPKMPIPDPNKLGIAAGKKKLDKRAKEVGVLTLRDVLKNAFTKTPSMKESSDLATSYLENRVGENMTGDDVIKFYQDLRRIDKQLGSFVWKNVIYPIFGAPADVILDIEIGG